MPINYQYVPRTYIHGRLVKHRRTKQLLLNAAPRQIFLIHHQDLDEMAALGLIASKARAVINAAPFMSGKYPTKGSQLLLQAEIPLFEIKADDFDVIPHHANVKIEGNYIYADELTAPVYCKPFTFRDMEMLTTIAKKNLNQQLSLFIDNTLQYAKKEKAFILQSLSLPMLKTSIKGRHVVIVVRGSGYKEDLAALKPYIEDYNPVFIGVDGGADALLDFNYTPALIVGDMDSVSDHALTCGAEIIVHAFPDGRAPGMKRMTALGLQACTVSAPGTSEDLAMLMAYECLAELIVTVGTHTHMIDFLEKGRPGMGSTLLVRMKLGSKLLDAKGVSKLYRKKFC